MTTSKKSCATCIAIATPGADVELAHLMGMLIGLEIVGGFSVGEARARAIQRLCPMHAQALFRGARYLHDSIKAAIVSKN
jgi:hypothetical protein